MVSGGPAQRAFRKARGCWKDLVPTGVNPTDRLLVAGVMLRNGLRKGTSACRGQTGLRRRPRVRNFRFPRPLVESDALRIAWIDMHPPGIGLSEVGKTCSPRKLRAFRPKARLDSGEERISGLSRGGARGG
jgi:hypothetical protein